MDPLTPLWILLGLATVGVGVAIVNSDHPNAPQPSGQPPLYPKMPLPAYVPNAPQIGVSLTCEQALNNLPDPALRTAVADALAASTDRATILQLAAGLEQAASAPNLTDLQRAALMRCAACARDRAALVMAAPSPYGGVLKQPPLTSTPAVFGQWAQDAG